MTAVADDQAGSSIACTNIEIVNRKLLGTAHSTGENQSHLPILVDVYVDSRNTQSTSHNRNIHRNATPLQSPLVKKKAKNINKKRSRSLQPECRASESSHRPVIPPQQLANTSNLEQNKSKRTMQALTTSHRRIIDQLNEGIVKHCKYMSDLDPKEVIDNKYEITRCLGQGNFAVVSECIDKTDGNNYALKEIEYNELQDKKYILENEAYIMFTHRHSTICAIHEAYRTPYAYYLVLELAMNGDLFDQIKKLGTLPSATIARIVYDTATALKFLHKRKIVHRDIKPENLLLSNDFHVKLTDFGLACRVDGPLYRVCGTPTYVAPEILSEVGYGVEVDLWSLGIITHICLVGYAPFRSQQRERLFELIKEGALSMDLNEWLTVPQGAKRLIRKMLTIDVMKRMSARRLCANRWLNAAIQSYGQQAEPTDTLRTESSISDHAVPQNSISNQ